MFSVIAINVHEFQNETGIEVTTLSCCVSLVYSLFMDAKKRDRHLPMEWCVWFVFHAFIRESFSIPFEAFVENMPKHEVLRHHLSVLLEVMATDPKTDEDIEDPYITSYKATIFTHPALQHQNCLSSRFSLLSSQCRGSHSMVLII
ncbi:hypothetical protein ANCCAN_24412 [Ancylostoma caninum]|uniref:Ubiquitin-activating enzyme E1 C-terminal domain-containing protein n=1 Tax=Ancylostoma caninum TaxID=29170 RepID=A0A368FCH5_ANCCA|nr:hypothetical protein ANCCAN_24412 [Ancylostoma caninum]